MSGPQATMNVRIGADIAPLKDGLKQAQNAITQSAKVMGTAITSAAPTQADGSSVAREFVRGITAEFNAANTKLKAALFQGQISQAEFKRQGEILARDFNAGLTQGMEQIGAAGLLTPGVEASLVAKYKRAGLMAGEAFSSGVVPEVEKSNIVIQSMERVGHRSVGNLITGLTMLSTTADQSAGALGKVGHAIEMAGFVLGGPEIGAAVAVGVTLIEQVTEHFEHAKKAAEDAEAAFKSSLDTMVNAGDGAGLKTTAQTLFQGTRAKNYQDGLVGLTSKIASDKAAVQAMGPLGALANPKEFNRLNAEIAETTQQLDTLKAHFENLQRAINAPDAKAPALGILPGVHVTADDPQAAAAKAKKAFDDQLASATRLLDADKLLQAGWAGLDTLGQRQLDTLGRLTAMWDRQKDKTSAAAMALADLIAKYQQLSVVQLASGMGTRSAESFMSATPNTAGLPAPGALLSLPTSPLPDSAIHQLNINTSQLPSKLDTLGDIFKSSIASQAQFIAQSLTTVLGVRNANAGGAIGSVIGGAFGQGVATSILGSGAGAILGSVVPVVGTVIGSLAGGAIGNAIGSLFGHHKKAADNSASALDNLATAAAKVSEALSNVPQGFKVAYYRWEAATAVQVPAYGGASAGSGITIYGDVNFHGVQDIPQMYDQLSDYATAKGTRGGSQRLAVALSGGRA